MPDPGLAATSPAVTHRAGLDLAAPDILQYRSYLAGRRAEFLRAAGLALAEPPRVIYGYDVAFNGLALQTTHAGAARLLDIPGVAADYRDEMRHIDTGATVDYLGINLIWAGGGGLPGTRGNGTIVAVIDTGVWPEHPSFADNGAYPSPPVKWQGGCQQPADTSPGYTCNNKLIGVQYFLDGYQASQGGQYDGLYFSGRDDVGHGTHTASVAAGNENVTATSWPPAPRPVEIQRT